MNCDAELRAALKLVMEPSFGSAFMSVLALLGTASPHGPSTHCGGLLSAGAAEVTNGQVIHSVLVDECEDLVYAASRETGRVMVYNSDTMALVHTHNLADYGRTWALKMGPYGNVLALSWNIMQVGHETLGWTVLPVCMSASLCTRAVSQSLCL